jgi:aryl-alcohol dehydrogenase-like predicted oxidoreductase
VHAQYLHTVVQNGEGVATVHGRWGLAVKALIRKWLGCRCLREELLIATKVAGPGGMDWLRGGPASLSRADITEALDGSLRRLGTDYVDLYQIHWPCRCALPAG